jgi:manganese-dependent inorganic pyrophosphatase
MKHMPDNVRLFLANVGFIRYTEIMIYITGHRRPDTDSIASAIAYAQLKNSLGQAAVPCRLGELNQETKYLLKRFGFETPMHLRDARSTLAEIELDAPVSIGESATIFEALKLMNEQKQRSLAVTDENGQVLGILTMQDLSRVGMWDTALGIDLLGKTRAKDVCRTINGKMLWDAGTNSNGKVSIIALTQAGARNYDVKGRIVIMGSHKQAQLDVLEQGAAMMILVWTGEVSPDVLAKAREKGCSVMISGHGTMNTSRYLYFSSPASLLMTRDVTALKEDMLCEEAALIMQKKRFRLFPVTDGQGRLKGYAGRYHIMNAQNKEIILVDHNEFSQSVQGIEKARLREVLDHHRIHDFSTDMPVAFRNEIVGSTATIVAGVFREKQIMIPKNTAGLLLGAILSDTLRFRSVTTTQQDIFMASVLAEIAGLNLDEFAKDMFKVSTNLAGRKMEDILAADLKEFDMEDVATAVSQVIIYSIQDIQDRLDEVRPAMDVLLGKLQSSTLAVCFTSIQENGSYVLSAGRHADWVQVCYPGGLDVLQAGVLSRKNQIVPSLSRTFARQSQGI